MFVRWLHKTWKFFWSSLAVLLIILAVFAASLFGLLQLDSTQKYIADRIERDFEKVYRADLTIGRLDGYLPFRFRLENISLQDTRAADSTAEGDTRADTLVTIESMDAQLDIWNLLQNRVSITGFSMENPRVRFLVRDNRYSLMDILKQRNLQGEMIDTVNEKWIERVEVIAPRVRVTNGSVYVERFFDMPREVQLPEPLKFENLNAVMFLELSELQRFLDIENLSGEIINSPIGQIAITGQVYNDKRFLEFNGFNISTGGSDIKLNGEIDGVDLYRDDISGQLLDAHYNVDIASEYLLLSEMVPVFPSLPAVEEPVEFSIQSEGKIDSLWIDEFTMGIGESYFDINGFVENIMSENLFYRFRLDEVALFKNDVEIFSGPLDQQQYSVLENLSITGNAEGNSDTLTADLSLDSPIYGQVSLQGKGSLKSPYTYRTSLIAKNVDIAPLLNTSTDTTRLNFDATVNGVGYSLQDGVVEFTASAYNSFIGDIWIDRLDLRSSLVNGFLEQEYTYVNGNQNINGTGWADFSNDEIPVSFKGNARDINLASYFGSAEVVSTTLNFDYNFEVRGVVPDQFHGRANLDIKRSVINGDTVRAHQLYMDLDDPSLETRTFRLTSSLFDMSLTGTLDPSNIQRQYRYWANYLENRYCEEILMDSTGVSTPGPASVDPLSIDGEIQAKDLSLVRKYWPDFPDLRMNSRIEFNINADSSRMLMSAEARTDTFELEELEIDRSNVQLTASFRHDQLLKQFSSIDFQTDASFINTGLVEMDSIFVDLSMKDDSLTYSQQVGRISNDARFRLSMHSKLNPDHIRINITDFFMGNERYAWQNEQTPSLAFNRNDKLIFNNFRFSNEQEFMELRGSIGPARRDSLQMELANINLRRISDLVNGRVSFSGILNGSLVSRSLTRSPTVQGDLAVNRLELQDRLVGDARFSSAYNPERSRFDTEIRILTDSTRYGRYLEDNDNIGQNILLDGYFVPPDPDVAQDSVFYFDVDFNEVDMWVVPLIVHRVFDEMEGKATGSGYLTGNLEDIDFHADFQTENVFAKPKFLNTNYFVNGHVAFDRDQGVVLDSLNVTDTSGGTGTVWGSVDLNDFKPITYLDLTFRLNDLQFLNNTYDPDVPFYGTVAGTGLVRLTGANTDLLLRTNQAVQVSEDSKISIPLIEETELQENNRFIQFVDEFGGREKQMVNIADNRTSTSGSGVDEETLEEAIENLTFSERFDLDLQFNAPNNVNVDLIFDPVIDEVLTAQGTGQLRITMQAEEVQMFGHYDISGGSYRFVAGDIFSRRLDLVPGGSIVWEGDPANARLNINAIYHARPSISSLTGRSPTGTEGTGGQQVPVDLVVEIRGTVSSVENNYYFRLPNTLDISSRSTLSFAISQINRDEQQKILQAAMILINGQFIPTQSYDDATSSLSQTLTRGSTVINPLLSNQVISPLLSNQINTLLNSDVSRFDIDFNLNAYNEIDLGIALRLYNDRLILRREGQITGGSSQSTLGERLGDLNATYRINNSLSLTAFHRQDQALGGIATSPQTGDVTPSVDGIGLEAEVKFNTWRDLKRRIRATFRKIFGINKDDEKENRLVGNKNDEQEEKEN